MELKDKYNTVLIVGNGFDLNLGLKTSYSDFVKSHEFLDLVKKGNMLSKYLNENQELNNWIDIETELKLYSKTLPPNDSSLLPEFKELTASLQKYLESITYSDIKKDSEAYRQIKKVTKDNVLILNFNYTHTLSIIFEDLDVLVNTPGSNIHLERIHGSIEFQNIIIGIEDQVNISPNHIFLKKSTNSNYNTKDFSSILENSSNIIFFGHSLGETDHMYFNDFFSKACISSLQRKSKKIYIYYHGEISYYQIFAQLDEMTMKRIARLRQTNEFEMIDTKKYKE